MQQLGKYQLVRKLAAGGMAEVFLAKAAGPMGFEKTLVVKRILPELAADPQFVKMFLAEAKLAANLNHPNIAQIFDFGLSEGAYFIAMEHVDGPNLRKVSRRAAERSIPLPVPLCAKIISYTCEALAYAHEYIDPGTATPLSVIHRDVSPENIMLSRNGAVKVVDFGIAKAAGQPHHTETGVVRGKISYMPPEQIQGQEIDHRADIFALGVVLYELITGSKPFDARSDRTILQAILKEQIIPAVARRPDVPEPMTRILQRALDKDPDGRYPTCRHFQADLERFIVSTGEPVSAYHLATLVSQLRGTTSSMNLHPAVPATRSPGLSEVPAAAPPPSASSGASSRATLSPSPAGGGSDTARRHGDNAERSPATDRAALKKLSGASIAVLIGGGLIAAAAGVSIWREASRRAGGGADSAELRTLGARQTPSAGPVRRDESDEAAKASPGGAAEGGYPGAAVSLEFRIRPYATVFLDGKLLGQTPFPAVQVSEGRHFVKLVNADLKKEVAVEYVVKAGRPNVFKYNLAPAEK